MNIYYVIKHYNADFSIKVTHEIQDMKQKDIQY